MKLSVIPKFRSVFFDATEYDLQEGEQVTDYELPKELVDSIRNPPKVVKEGKSYNVPDWANTYNVYLIIKKED